MSCVQYFYTIAFLTALLSLVTRTREASDHFTVMVTNGNYPCTHQNSSSLLPTAALSGSERPQTQIPRANDIPGNLGTPKIRKAAGKRKVYLFCCFWSMHDLSSLRDKLYFQCYNLQFQGHNNLDNSSAHFWLATSLLMTVAMMRQCCLTLFFPPHGVLGALFR